jgi:hypothetical protein
MLISRNQEHSGNLLPSAHNYIAGIPERLLFHVEHEIRHPLSAYSTSLRLIAVQWVKFLDELDKLRAEYFWAGDTKTDEVVKDEYAQLLHRLNEHQDACYSVLRAICPPNLAKLNRVDSIFLDRANLPGWKSFRAATKPYREDHIGLIVNNLKHRQGELSSIAFKSLSEFRPGYFLRDTLPGGAMGPCRKLHTGGNTAFSYARDQLLHLWWLYRIGDLLSGALTTANLKLSNLKITPIPQPVPQVEWSNLLIRLAQIKPEYFPDELVKPLPLVKVSRVPSIFTIEFPSGARGIPLNMTSICITTGITLDSAYLTHKVPYFGYIPQSASSN